MNRDKIAIAPINKQLLFAMEDRELKDVLLDMISWFHNYCVDHDIRYYAIGGTLLGAVRHEGFIPWDEDMDVGVPRKDYNRLLELLGNSVTDKYLLESPYSSAKEFMFPHSKLYDTTTTVIENTKIPVKRGVSIDIFPLDGIGDTEEEALKNFKKIKLLLDIHTACTVKIKKNRSLVKNILVFLMVPISKLVNAKKLGIKIDKECTKRDFDDSKYCGDLVGRYRQKEIVERDIFGTPVLYKFENIEIFGVEKYDEYLTHVYGNWREVPPPEKRKQMHNILYANYSEPFIK